ncbi:MAG: hypothetical protein HY619_07480 [Thaumarchaeota archaeon]|nr:hypothetical protein [Nitrososphaerota archaeon]
MVKLSYEPYKEIVVKEYIYYPKPETLASVLAAYVSTGHPGVLLWAEGVVFLPVPLPPETEELVNQFLEGKLYWSSVAFTSMPVYQSSIRVYGVEIPVIDINFNSNMKDAAVWLKSRIPERS